MGESVGFTGQYAELTQRIIGVFFGVLNELGTGFVEAVYRRSMMIALREVGIRVEEEVAMPVSFHGKWVGTFHADLVVEGCVVLELKVADEMSPAFRAQLLNYLRSSEIEVGIVLAFGTKARYERVTMRNDRKRGLQKVEA